MDYTADDAMQPIKEKRAVADPTVGYIQERIRKSFAKSEKSKLIKQKEQK